MLANIPFYTDYNLSKYILQQPTDDTRIAYMDDTVDDIFSCY